jgi:hypothetical protein
MKTKILLLAVMICIVAICGYTQDSESTETKKGSVELPAQPSKDNAMVYVVRPSSFLSPMKIYVYVDKRNGSNRTGYTMGRQYIYFPVSPGKHKVISEANNTKTIMIDVKAGETIFIKQNTTRGRGFNQDFLEILDPEEGEHFVSITSLGAIDKLK